MPTTLRNTDILFNDGTTQSTAALPRISIAAGSTSLVGGNFPTATSTSTSYVLSQSGFLITGSGTITTRMRAQRAANDYGQVANAWARIYINGVAVGSEFFVSSGTTGFVFLNQDFAVNYGDFIQVASRVQAWASSASMVVLGNNRLAASAVTFVLTSSPF